MLDSLNTGHSKDMQHVDVKPPCSLDQNSKWRALTDPGRCKECAMCGETVLGKLSIAERAFGILPNCNHCYCWKCIRTRRDKRCPECGISSPFYLRSSLWVENGPDKDSLIKQRKEVMSRMPCLRFKRGKGTCLDGEKCLYSHKCLGEKTPGSPSSSGILEGERVGEIASPYSVVEQGHHWSAGGADRPHSLQHQHEHLSDADETRGYFVQRRPSRRQYRQTRDEVSPYFSAQREIPSTRSAVTRNIYRQEPHVYRTAGVYPAFDQPTMSQEDYYYDYYDYCDYCDYYYPHHHYATRNTPVSLRSHLRCPALYP